MKTHFVARIKEQYDSSTCLVKSQFVSLAINKLCLNQHLVC